VIIVEAHRTVAGDRGRNDQRSVDSHCPLATRPQHDLGYLTNFERKVRKLGKQIFRAIYSKSL